MDFADILKEEISAKRKFREEAEGGGVKKYMRRGDVKADRDSVADSAVETVIVEPVPEEVQPLPSVEAEDIATINEIKEDTKDIAPEITKHNVKDVEGEIFISAMETDKILLQDLKGDSTKVRTLISLFLKSLLKEQVSELKRRSPEVLASKEGKLATTIYQQSHDNLKILFKLLKRNEVPNDVLVRLTEICNYMQQREYIKANDSYLRLAIGNAPWPIGVTAVGIHQRSAQEKIKTTQVAHVLNDEVTRKWIQTVKRMMTFCQTKYPSSSRAKMVYNI